MLNIDPKVFRAYDIRGIFGEQITTDLAYLVGRAVVRFLKEKQSKDKLQVVLSRDGRNSSPELFEATQKGILDEGADVIDIDLMPTPVFYFTVWNYDYNGGIQITASHNPPEYNGFKLNQENASMIAGNTGIDQIRDMVLEMESKKPEPAGQKGEIIKKDVLDDYLESNLKNFNLDKFKDFKIAVDTANGAAGVLIEKLDSVFKGEIVHLFKEVDGSFPNHAPDPSKPANLVDLQKAVKEQGANLGVAFDADGDRVAIVDERGEAVPASYILPLIAQKLLKNSPNETIAYNFMSNIAPEVIKDAGGKPIETRVGFTFVKEKMKQENAIFGGEYSGHFLFRDQNYCEAPLLTLFNILEEMATKQKSLSELILPFKKYFLTDIMNLEVEDKEKAIRDLEERYSEGEVSHLDGVRIDLKDWWLHARPSNTENLLRVIVEAGTKELAEAKLAEIKQII